MTNQAIVVNRIVIVDRLISRSLVSDVVRVVAGAGLTAALAQLTWDRRIWLALIAFLVGDLIKALIAAALLPAAWWAVRTVRRPPGDRS